MSASDLSPRRSRRVETAHKPGVHPRGDDNRRLRLTSFAGLPSISDKLARELKKS